MSKSHKILNIPALFQPIKVTKLSKCAKPNHCQNRKNFQHNCSFSTDKVAKLSKYAKLNICQNRRNFQYTCSFSADKVAKLSKCAKFNHRQSRRNFQYTCSFSAEPRCKSLRPTGGRLCAVAVWGEPPLPLLRKTGDVRSPEGRGHLGEATRPMYASRHRLRQTAR